VVAISWEHKGSFGQTRRARFHCFHAPTGNIVLEHYVSEESMYEVFSNTFHAYRIDSTNPIIGIQFVSSMDAQYLAQIFSNVLALELHRKTLDENNNDDNFEQQEMNLGPKASANCRSMNDVREIHREEMDTKAVSTASYSGRSVRERRRPLSSKSSLHHRTIESTQDNSFCETRNLDIVSNPNTATRIVPVERTPSSFTQEELGQKPLKVFPASQQTSELLDRNRSFSNSFSDRTVSGHQKASRRWRSQVPMEISRCTSSDKYSATNRRSCQLSTDDVSLPTVTSKLHSNESRMNHNSGHLSPIRVVDARCSSEKERNWVATESHSSSQQSISSSSDNRKSVTERPEVKSPPQVVYENLLAELPYVAQEKIQDFIQSFLREGSFSPSTERLCKSQRMRIHPPD
jgi:hypothetical protein